MSTYTNIYLNFKDAPFGMVMPNRSWKAVSADGYGFGYQGSQTIPELSNDNYSTYYRELDTRLGRWWSKDPLANRYQSFSPYITMGNNPISKIDPRGDTDYYNSKGEYLGHDSNTGNGKVSVVVDSKVIKEIKKGAITFDAIPPAAQYILPPYEHRKEMERIMNTVPEGEAGYYEVAGVGRVGKTGDLVHIRAKDGSLIDPKTDTEARIRPTDIHDDDKEKFASEVDPDYYAENSTPSYVWHSHPDIPDSDDEEKKKTVGSGTTIGGSYDAWPEAASTYDITIGLKAEGNNNFVLSREAQKVYFFNSNTEPSDTYGGSDGSFDLKLFYTVQEGVH